MNDRSAQTVAAAAGVIARPGPRNLVELGRRRDIGPEEHLPALSTKGCNREPRYQSPLAPPTVGLPAATRCPMKIWADFSTVARLAVACLVLGFVLGLFAACSAVDKSAPPGPPDQDRAASSVRQVIERAL